MAAGGPTVTLTFAGDSSKLEKAFDNVGASSKGMADDVGSSSKSIGKNAGSGFDRMSAAADTADTRAMGFRDTITGVQDTMLGFGSIMRGNVTEGLLQLGMGFGDLASGAVNFLIPNLKAAGTAALTMGRRTVTASVMFVTSSARMVASMAVTVASVVAGWVAMGVQALIAAGRMALAWIIALGPIALIIAAVLAVIAVVFIFRDEIWAALKFVGGKIAQFAKKAWSLITSAFTAAKDWVIGAFNAVVAFFGSLPGKIGAFISRIAGHIRNALGAAWDWVVNKVQGVVSWFASLPGKIGGFFSSIGEGIKNAFIAAFNFVARAWNSTIGALSFTIPGWVPGIGGNTFSAPRIPTFHDGGVVQGRPGEEVLALLQAGETVTPRGESAASVSMVSIDSAAIGSAVAAALNGMSIDIDSRGMARLVNRQNRRDARR